MVKKTELQLASEHISQCARGLSCRYSPGPVAGKAMSFQLQHSSSLQSHNPLAEEQEEEGLLTDPTEKRFVPHLPALLLQSVLVTVSPQPRSRPAAQLVPNHHPRPEACPAVPHQQGHTDRGRFIGPGLLQGTQFSTVLWESTCRDARASPFHLCLEIEDD